MEFEELKTLGLSNGEVKVYSAVLNIGSSTINNIHEKTGMERRAIYDIINKLIEKGLLSYTIEKGKRTYQCSPPNRLKEEIKNKKAELERFEKLIPNIEGVYNSKKQKINVEIFRGKEGIKSLFEDMLSRKDLYIIGGGWYVAKEMPLFWANYDKRRIEKKVKVHNLVAYDAPPAPTKDFISIKKLPKEFTKNPTVIWVYGNKVVNVVWGQEFFAFMMESKDIAENHKQYFDYLWNNVAK